MAEPDKPALTTAEQQELAAAWTESIVEVPDKQIQALLLGRNVRINVAEAFKAAWTTAKIYLTSKKIILTGITSPAEVIGITADVYNLIVTTLDALQESMLPLDYTACVVLSSAPDGMTEQEFEQQLTQFLASGEAAGLPWYLGLTSSRLHDAHTAFQVRNGFTRLMDRLWENDWLIEEGGKVKFKPHHFT
jgi:hypothetical protein